MKTIIKCLLIFSLNACSESEDEPIIQTPAEKLSGTYLGELINYSNDKDTIEGVTAEITVISENEVRVSQHDQNETPAYTLEFTATVIDADITIPEQSDTNVHWVHNIQNGSGTLIDSAVVSYMLFYTTRFTIFTGTRQ